VRRAWRAVAFRASHRACVDRRAKLESVLTRSSKHPFALSSRTSRSVSEAFHFRNGDALGQVLHFTSSVCCLYKNVLRPACSILSSFLTHTHTLCHLLLLAHLCHFPLTTSSSNTIIDKAIDVLLTWSSVHCAHRTHAADLNLDTSCFALAAATVFPTFKYIPHQAQSVRSACSATYSGRQG